MRNILIPFVMLGVLTGCSSEMFGQESYCLAEVERDGFDHMTVVDMSRCKHMNDDLEIYHGESGEFEIGDVVYSVSDVETQRHNPVKVVPVPVITTPLKPTTIIAPPLIQTKQNVTPPKATVKTNTPLPIKPTAPAVPPPAKRR